MRCSGFAIPSLQEKGKGTSYQKFVRSIQVVLRLLQKKEYYNGNIPFIRSGELHKDYTELFITEAGLSNSAAKLVETGDLLLALYGATSGDIAISKIKGAINQAILCIRTKQNKKFIESVWNKHVERLLQTYLQGGQGNLSADIVKNIPLYLRIVTNKINWQSSFLCWMSALPLKTKSLRNMNP